MKAPAKFVQFRQLRCRTDADADTPIRFPRPRFRACSLSMRSQLQLQRQKRERCPPPLKSRAYATAMIKPKPKTGIAFHTVRSSLWQDETFVILYLGQRHLPGLPYMKATLIASDGPHPGLRCVPRVGLAPMPAIL